MGVFGEPVTYTIQWGEGELEVICDKCGDQVLLVEDTDSIEHEAMMGRMQDHALDRHGQHYQP